MPRGSKPGERRGGRQKGTPNKARAEVKVLAQKYAPAAIEELGRLSTEAESEIARVAAGKEILDRAYGAVSSSCKPAGASQFLLSRNCEGGQCA